MKRVISIVMLLAVLLSFGACKTKETAVSVETTIDYASPEAMYGHISQTEPVNGVFQLWSVEGLQNMHKYPDANFELLCNIDAKGAEIAPLGSVESPSPAPSPAATSPSPISPSWAVRTAPSASWA